MNSLFLRIKAVVRKNPFFWQDKIKKVYLIFQMKCPVPNLLGRDMNVALEFDSKLGWIVGKDLNQLNNEISNTESEQIIDAQIPVKNLSDEVFILVFRQTLGNTHFDKTRLVPSRAIARLAGLFKWKYAKNDWLLEVLLNNKK